MSSQKEPTGNSAKTVEKQARKWTEKVGRDYGGDLISGLDPPTFTPRGVNAHRPTRYVDLYGPIATKPRGRYGLTTDRRV